MQPVNHQLPSQNHNPISYLDHFFQKIILSAVIRCWICRTGIMEQTVTEMGDLAAKDGLGYWSGLAVQVNIEFSLVCLYICFVDRD